MLFKWRIWDKIWFDIKILEWIVNVESKFKGCLIPTTKKKYISICKNLKINHKKKERRERVCVRNNKKKRKEQSKKAEEELRETKKTLNKEI